MLCRSPLISELREEIVKDRNQGGMKMMRKRSNVDTGVRALVILVMGRTIPSYIQGTDRFLSGCVFEAWGERYGKTGGGNLTLVVGLVLNIIFLKFI